VIEFEARLTQGRFTLHVSLRCGERVRGLFGPSGAGKSTLLNVLAGSVNPAHGRIVIDGRCLLDTEARINVPIHQRRIGIVYQDGRLFPHLSVRRNLQYGMHLLKASERRFDLGQIVDLLEIEHLLEKRPQVLSGGERQRVALGRALLASPRMLLLDEPMASLDERLKAQILPFLRRLKEETTVPIIYVSHALREILELTQYLVVMQDGEILGSGNYHEVLTSQSVLPLAQSLGIDNLLSVRVLEHCADLGYSVGSLAGQKLILPLSQAVEGTDVTLVVPASNVSLASSFVTGTSIQNQIRGTVTAIRVVEHRAVVSVDIGTTLLAEVTEKSVRDLQIERGQEIVCLIKAQSLRFLGV
jgi:molybdate transport system ATP-binding protein